MASFKCKSNLDESQKSTILQLVNLIDRSALEENTLSESCSGHRRSKSVIFLAHRKHRQGHCVEKHTHQAEHCQSDPGSCILEPTRYHKHELDISIKKKRTHLPKPILEYFGGVPEERLISKRKRKKVNLFGCQASSILYSSTANSVKLNKLGTGTFKNNVLTTYPYRNRMHLMRSNPFAKSSFYTMNLQVKRQRKGYKLEPYECEPGVCVPGQCDPIECQKRIMRRLMRKASTMTSTDNRSQSSETARFHLESRSKKQQFINNKHVAKPKVAFERHGLQNNTLPQTQGVHIGSNISFSIQFSKGTFDGYRGRKSSTGTTDSNKGKRSSTGTDTFKRRRESDERDAKQFRTQGTRDHIARNFHRSSQSSTAMHHKGSNITSKYKRCFCTLKLQKRGKQHKAREFLMAENPPKGQNRGTVKTSKENRKPIGTKMISYGTESPHFQIIPRVKDAYNTTRLHKVDPYECEPGVCTPGLCDPYECEKLIKKRLRREFGTSTQEYHARSTATGARKGKKLKDQDAQSIQTHDRPQKNRKQGMGNVKPSNYSIGHKHEDREERVVRVGSSISFNIEFYKNSSPSRAIGSHKAISKSTSNDKVQGTTLSRSKNDRGILGNHIKLVHRPSQSDRQRMNSKASGVGPLLKRCFCTLTLQKSGKQQPVKKPKEDQKNMTKNISVATANERKEYKPILYKEMATKTRKKYLHLEPYECEPGTCVPGYCNPVECYERIKQRHLKTSGTGTRTYPTKSVSILTGQQRSHMRKLQTPNIEKHYASKPLQTNVPMVGISRPPAVSPNNEQGVKFGSNISINIEFYKKNNSPNNFPVTEDSGSAHTLRLHDKYGNTNIYKKGLTQKTTDTHRESTDSEIQSKLETKNKASAAGKALKRCFCTAKLHHPSIGTTRKRAVIVGRIDKVQTMSPFKPTQYCVPCGLEREPCNCNKKIISKGTKLNEKYLEGKKPQQNNINQPKMKIKYVNKKALKKDKNNAVIILHKKSKQNKLEKPENIQIKRKDVILSLPSFKQSQYCMPGEVEKETCVCTKKIKTKGTQFNEKSLEGKIPQLNNLKPPKVKIQKVNSDDDHKKSVRMATKEEMDIKSSEKNKPQVNNAKPPKVKFKIANSADDHTKSVQKSPKTNSCAVKCISEIKLKLQHFLDVCIKKTQIHPLAVVNITGNELTKNITALHDQRHGLESTVVMVGGADLDCIISHGSEHTTEDTEQEKSKKKDIKYKCERTCSFCKHIHNKREKKKKKLSEIMTECTKEISAKYFAKNILQQSHTKPTNVKKPDKDVKENKHLIQKLKTEDTKLMPKRRRETQKHSPPPSHTVVESRGDELTKNISALNDRRFAEETTTIVIGGADVDCKISHGSKYTEEDRKYKKSKKRKDGHIKYKGELETILPYAPKKYKKRKSKTLLITKNLDSEPEGNKMNLTPKLSKLLGWVMGLKKWPCAKTINEPEIPVEYAIAEVSGNKLVRNVCFSKDPTKPEAVIFTGTDVSCKITKGHRKVPRDKVSSGKSPSDKVPNKKKDKTPCVCGSLICAKESQKIKNKAELKTSKKIPTRKPCDCGSPVCERAVSVLDRYDKIKSKLDPRVREQSLSKREQRAMKKREQKRKKIQKKMDKIHNAKYLKTLKQRQKIYKKDDKLRLKERIKKDVEMFKQVKKYSNTSDSILLAESLFDIAKLGCTAAQDVTRSAYRAAVDPKHSYQNLKLLATDPDRACAMCKRHIQESGVISTLKRVKMRLTAMKRFKSVKEKLDNNPAMSYMIHMTDKDPKKRMKVKKKKKQTRKREPLDFNCSLYMATLRRRPYLSVYYMCPWFYPHCLSLLNVWKQLSDIALFLLAMVVWSPCILMMEACRALLCCTVCTG